VLWIVQRAPREFQMCLVTFVVQDGFVAVVLGVELVGFGVLFLEMDPFGGASAILGGVFPADSFLQGDEVHFLYQEDQS
jgi:hypothetical protein